MKLNSVQTQSLCLNLGKYDSQVKINVILEQLQGDSALLSGCRREDPSLQLPGVTMQSLRMKSIQRKAQERDVEKGRVNPRFFPVVQHEPLYSVVQVIIPNSEILVSEPIIFLSFHLTKFHFASLNWDSALETRILTYTKITSLLNFKKPLFQQWVISGEPFICTIVKTKFILYSSMYPILSHSYVSLYSFLKLNLRIRNSAQFY